MDPVEKVAMMGEIIWKLEKINVFVDKLRGDGDIPKSCRPTNLRRIPAISKQYRLIYNRIAGGEPVKRQLAKDVKALETDVRTVLHTIQHMFVSYSCFGLTESFLAKKLPGNLKTARSLAKQIGMRSKRILQFGDGANFEDPKTSALRELNKKYCQVLLDYFEKIKGLKENLFKHVRQRLKLSIRLIREHDLTADQLGPEKAIVKYGMAGNIGAVVRGKNFLKLIEIIKALDRDMNESLKPRMRAIKTIGKNLETVHGKLLLYNIPVAKVAHKFELTLDYAKDPPTYTADLWTKRARALLKLETRSESERTRINSMEKPLLKKLDQRLAFLKRVAREFNIKHPRMILDQLPVVSCTEHITYGFVNRYRHKYDLATQHILNGLKSHLNANINRLQTFLKRVQSASIADAERRKLLTSTKRLIQTAMECAEQHTRPAPDAIAALEKMSKRIIEYSLQAQEYFDTALEKLALKVETRQRIETWLVALGLDRAQLTQPIILSVHPFWRKRDEIQSDLTIKHQARELAKEYEKYARALDMYSDLAVRETSSSASHALTRRVETERAITCLKSEMRKLKDLEKRQAMIVSDLEDHAKILALDQITGTKATVDYRTVLREADRRFQQIQENLQGYHARVETITRLPELREDTATKLEVEGGITVYGDTVQYTLMLQNRNTYPLRNVIVRIAVPSEHIELLDPVSGTVTIPSLPPRKRANAAFNIAVHRRVDAEIYGYITFATPQTRSGHIRLPTQGIDMLAPFLALLKIEPAEFYARITDPGATTQYAGFYVTNTDVDMVAQLISDQYEHMFEAWNFETSENGRKMVTIWNAGRSPTTKMHYLLVASVRRNPLTPTVDVGLLASCANTHQCEQFLTEVKNTLTHMIKLESLKQKVNPLDPSIAKTIINDTMLKSKNRLEELGVLSPEGIVLPSPKRAACDEPLGRFAAEEEDLDAIFDFGDEDGFEVDDELGDGFDDVDWDI